MNHYPFDDGRLSAPGALVGQKTVKAICGKRVPFNAHSHEQHVDCPNCRVAIERRRNDTAALAGMGMSIIPTLARAVDETVAMLDAVLAR